MLARLFIIALILWQCSTAWGQTKLVARRSCVKPIGRIYGDGDRYLSTRSLVCEGDYIYPRKDGGTVEALCFLNQKFVQLPSGLISPDKCREPDPGLEKRCTLETPQGCPKSRGSGESKNTTSIIRPYGTVLLTQAPVFSWYPVPGATTYKVYLKGYNLDWIGEPEPNKTTLPYPQQQNKLKYGTAYEVTILVKQSEEVVGSASSVIYVLPENQVQEILEQVAKVNALGLPPDEAAYLDLDSVYMSKSLLNETIETMNARVAAGSQSPTLYRVLGDRYLEAWLPNEAKRVYTKAVELAQGSGNSVELEIAQERLRNVVNFQSQLPTSKKAAQ